jgi:AAA15 family ATPase/GTPase
MQIRIIQFSLENFRAFKERATFSMEARKNDLHTFASNEAQILKTSLIYGPNASGKTSILDAFGLMKRLMRLSANIQENTERAKLPHFTFQGSEEFKLKPTSFEAIFSLENNKYDGIYRYNFSFIQDHIISESLSKITTKEKLYFSRDNQNIQILNEFDEMRSLIGQVRKESLFLSVAAQLNNNFAIDLLDAFNSIIVSSGITPISTQNTFKKIKEDSSYREKFLQYLKAADFCIVGAETQEIEVNGIELKIDEGKISWGQKKEKDNMLILEHPVYNTKNEKVSTFKLDFLNESKGTQKFIASLGPIIDALEDGRILFIDEFDNSLHPLLTKFIINLFESSQLNQKNAQLIVTTHDTSLLASKDELIKDQFWFTEKDEFGSAKLFSLGEFELRNNTEYSKKYLEGRFGALPIISSP